MGAETLSARGRFGQAMRRHRDDPKLIETAQRDLAVAKIADYIQATVDAAPPLTVDQRERLVVLLRGGGAA